MSRAKPVCTKPRATKPKVIPLLPCPFCGSPGWIGLWSMSTYWSAGCQGNDCLDFPNRFETKAKAISFWNTRYQP